MNEIVEAKEEVVEFDYSLVDKETSDFLKNKGQNIGELLGNTYTGLGKEFKEAQEKLARGKYGCFEEWYTSLGFKKNYVYNLINRFNLIVCETNNKNLIEEMPMTLVNEITKKNADPELKEMALSGEIKTTKEYRKLEEQKKIAERIADEERKAKEEAEQETKKVMEETGHMIEQQKQMLDRKEEQIRELRNKEPEVKEVPVPQIPIDYEHIKESNAKLEQKLTNLSRLVEDKDIEIENATKEKEILERKAKLNERDSEKYKQLKDEIENLSKEKNDLGRQIKSRTELSGLVVRIEHILKTELAPIKYSRAIDEASTDEIVTRNLRDIVNRVEGWCQDMYEYIPKVQANENIIDVEVVEYE